MSQNTAPVADRAALTELERKVIDQINNNEPWQLLDRFSELERVTGTQDEERAAEYITDRLDALGVEYNRYDPEMYISQPHDASVSIKGKSFETGPVKTPAFSESGSVTGELIYVGESNASDVGNEESDDDQYHALQIEKPYDEVDNLDGKVAITAAGSLSIRAIGILEEAGAAGVIAIHQHEKEPHSGIATSVWGGAPPYDERDRIPDIPVINVRRPDGEQLREWALNDDETIVEIETDLTTEWMTAPVVIAEIEGEADPSDEDFVLLHGHYDSWFVGITDNATGDAALLEMARVLSNHSSELKGNLRVAWWPGHSTGRYSGSTWYADEFAHDLRKNCVMHIDVDSPGAKGSTEYTDMSCWMPETHDLVTEVIEEVTGAPYEENRPRRAGDYSFNNLGLSGSFTLSSNIPREVREEEGWYPVGGCGGNADAWHLSTDTLETAGKEELLRDMRMYATLVTRVLNSDVIPLNHQRNIERHMTIVEDYQQMAGENFDFGPTLEELDRLKDTIDRFYEEIENGSVPTEEANEAIKQIARVLTRLNFVSEGIYEQDPAYHRPRYPRYAVTTEFDEIDQESDEHGFVQVQLKREQNHVVDKLRQVSNIIEKTRA